MLEIKKLKELLKEESAKDNKFIRIILTTLIHPLILFYYKIL